LSLIRAEGFDTPSFMAVKKVLNPECNTLLEQHTPANLWFDFRAGLLIISPGLGSDDRAGRMGAGILNALF